MDFIEIMHKVTLLTIFLLLSISTLSQTNSLEELYNESKKAYQSGNYLDFLHFTKEALKIHPSQPTLLYNHAAGLALTGERDKALSELEYLITWNASLSIDDDTDFAGLLKNNEMLKKISKKKNQFNVILQQSLKEIRVNGKYHLEDLYIIKDNLYATDVYHGKLLIIDVLSGKVKAFHNLGGSGMALAFNESANTLWVSSAMFPQYKDYFEKEKDKGTLLEYDIASNKIIHQIILPEPAIIGSMVFHEEMLYASNSSTPEVIVINPENYKITRKIKIDNAFSLQGITVDKKNNYLFVADYIRGIVRIDLDSNNDYKWFSSPDYLLKGIDGLTLVDSQTFLAIQNNSTPKRVVKIKMDKDLRVKNVRLLDNGIFGEAEPTNGFLLSGKEFYYIGNSPWPFYDQEGNAQQSKWSTPEIRLIKLED